MSNDSNTGSPRNADWQAQERALDQLRRGTQLSGVRRVDAYRAVFQAVAQAPRSGPPADFAAVTARAVREAQIDEYIERWMIRITGLIAVIAVLIYAGPMLLDSVRTSTALALLPSSALLGSPWVWAAGAGTLTAAAFDLWAKARAGDGPAHA